MKRIVSTLLLAGLGFTAAGQDPSFSQFFASSLYLNPAFAGHPKYMRVGMVYRNQWLAPQSPFVTYGVSFDRAFRNRMSGFGVLLVNDVQGQGAISRLSADVMFTHMFRVAFNARVKLGVQAGGVMRSRNPRDLVFPDMLTPDGQILGPSGVSGSLRFMPNFAVGAIGEWNNFYGGIAVHHLAQPVEGGYGGQRLVLPRRYTVHVGMDIFPYRRLRFYRNALVISPNIIYMQQQRHRQLNLGVYFTRARITTGLWHKQSLTFLSPTFAIMVGYSADRFRLGYSYDFSLLRGGFRGIQTSVHEVTFGYNFEYNTRPRRRINAIRCPKF